MIGLAIGALIGYVTRPETAEIRFGPISVEVRGNNVARGGGELTSSQVEHIAIIALIGGLIGLGLGFGQDGKISSERKRWHTLHFELVSPEKLVFSGEVEQVDVPGAEGDFGVLAGHAPFVTTLRPGILTVHGAGGAQKIVVLGGFAEVSAEGLTVLADVAEAVEDIDRGMIATRIGEMESSASAKMEPGSELDKLITRLDQFKTVDRHLTGTAMH